MQYLSRRVIILEQQTANFESPWSHLFFAIAIFFFFWLLSVARFGGFQPPERPVCISSVTVCYARDEYSRERVGERFGTCQVWGVRAKTHPSSRNSVAYRGPPSLSDSVGRTDKTMMNRVEISRKSLSCVCTTCVRVTRTHTRTSCDRAGAPRARSETRESRRRSSVSVKRPSKREYVSLRLPVSLSTYAVPPVESAPGVTSRFRFPA